VVTAYTSLHSPKHRGSGAFGKCTACRWGGWRDEIRRVSYREGAMHLRSTFLYAMSKALSDHTDFWSGETKLMVAADLRRKFKSLPVNTDLHLAHLAGSSGKARAALFAAGGSPEQRQAHAPADVPLPRIHAARPRCGRGRGGGGMSGELIRYDAM